MAVARKKKKPEEELKTQQKKTVSKASATKKTQVKTQAKKNPRLTDSESVGAMVRPSGEYDKTAHVLTDREVAEFKKKRKAAKKKK